MNIAVSLGKKERKLFQKESEKEGKFTTMKDWRAK